MCIESIFICSLKYSIYYSSLRQIHVNMYCTYFLLINQGCPELKRSKDDEDCHTLKLDPKPAHSSHFVASPKHVWIPVQVCISCLTLGKALHVPGPQFLLLEDT